MAAKSKLGGKYRPFVLDHVGFYILHGIKDLPAGSWNYEVWQTFIGAFPVKVAPSTNFNKTKQKIHNQTEKLVRGYNTKGRRHVTHLFTNTNRVVRYSDTTRSSFLTMSFKLRFCKFPLVIQKLQWLYVHVVIYLINFILQFELSLTVVCAQVSADLFLYHCMPKFGILTLLPPAKHPDTTNIYQMNNNWEVPQTLWLHNFGSC